MERINLNLQVEDFDEITMAVEIYAMHIGRSPLQQEGSKGAIRYQKSGKSFEVIKNKDSYTVKSI